MQNHEVQSPPQAIYSSGFNFICYGNLFIAVRYHCLLVVHTAGRMKLGMLLQSPCMVLNFDFDKIVITNLKYSKRDKSCLMIKKNFVNHFGNIINSVEESELSRFEMFLYCAGSTNISISYFIGNLTTYT